MKARDPKAAPDPNFPVPDPDPEQSRRARHRLQHVNLTSVARIIDPGMEPSPGAKAAMIEAKILRMARWVEITLCILAAPVILGFLYTVVRVVRWGLDYNYHLFRK